jgi:hypothetical protein
MTMFQFLVRVLDFLRGGVGEGGLSGTPTVCSLFENLIIWEVMSLLVKDA